MQSCPGVPTLTLSSDQLLGEMRWFIRAAAPYRGIDIPVVPEQIATQEHESNVLAQ